MSSIVVLKSGGILEPEGKDSLAFGEHAMALSDVQRVLDSGWNCPTVDGGTLHQNGFKLSSEGVRRSAEFRSRSAQKEEKEITNVLEDLGDDANSGDDDEILDLQEADSEKTKLEERGLRNRVWALEEEKCRLHKDLAAMTLKETILRDKVRDFELQMDSHKKRVDRAERTIIELRQALAQSNKQARRAEGEAEELRLLSARNEGEKQDMQSRVERLQQLCMDHEKSIHGLRQGLKNGMDGNKEGRTSRLQKELQRLSGVEITLRTDLEASRAENATLRRDINCLLERFANQQRETTMHMKKLEQELRAEIDRGQAKVSELQDENNILFAKLRLLTRERHDTREALRSCNDRVSDLEDENQSLQEEISNMESTLEAKQIDIQTLESQLERSIQNKEIAQTALALKDKASVTDVVTTQVKGRELQTASHLGAEMRQSLQAAAQQLYSMNQRLEALMDKLSERDLQLQDARADIAGKDEVVVGLERTLNNLAKTVDSQSSRIMRLSTQNEDLTISTLSQARQIEDLQAQVVTASDSKNKEEQELHNARKRLEEYEKHFESHGSMCQLLQERVDALQADLEHCQPQIKALLQQRDELVSERQNIHHSFTDATLRITDLEQRLADREDTVRLQEITLEELRKEVDEGRKELGRVKQERDEMQKEAEAMSREALRTSVEVEVLRRRVHQLDEDVLLRDGQICILRGGLDDS